MKAKQVNQSVIFSHLTEDDFYKLRLIEPSFLGKYIVKYNREISPIAERLGKRVEELNESLQAWINYDNRNKEIIFQSICRADGNNIENGVFSFNKNLIIDKRYPLFSANPEGLITYKDGSVYLLNTRHHQKNRKDDLDDKIDVNSPYRPSGLKANDGEVLTAMLELYTLRDCGLIPEEKFKNGQVGIIFGVCEHFRNFQSATRNNIITNEFGKPEIENNYDFYTYQKCKLTPEFIEKSEPMVRAFQKDIEQALAPFIDIQKEKNTRLELIEKTLKESASKKKVKDEPRP